MSKKVDKVYDFSGWATKNDITCSDGRIIKKNSFLENDGTIVPLVWNHGHDSPEAVIGHALLENRDSGVYAYCYLNGTDSGKVAKELVMNHDISSLSICANKLQQEGVNVIHGVIREVSLVLAGANPGASIDNVIAHSVDGDIEAIIYTGLDLEIDHSDLSEEDKGGQSMAVEKTDTTITKTPDPKTPDPKVPDTTLEHKDRTVNDVYEEMSDEQKEAVELLVGAAVETSVKEMEKGGQPMATKNINHNAFDNPADHKNEEEEKELELLHADLMETFEDAKSNQAASLSSNLKATLLQHADSGITDISKLFPDPTQTSASPYLIDRPQGWVSGVLGAVGRTPFSKVRSDYIDITADEARARGFIKGEKMEETQALALSRTTEPHSIVVFKSFDADDVSDITGFDVLTYMAKIMRTKLDEELARAILVGDGRDAVAKNHILPTNIRPIWTDDEMYASHDLIEVKTTDAVAVRTVAFMDEAVKFRKNYRGAGSPTFYTSDDQLANMLLLKDTTGRKLYNSVNDIAAALMVKEIVAVPCFDNLTRTVGEVVQHLIGIIVNLADYNIGADAGGKVNFLDAFDINYNKNQYLIKTRCSGAMVTAKGALVFEYKETAPAQG